MSNQLQITGGAKVRNLQGVITGTSGVLSSVPLGGANGVATLDSGGKVPVSQLPSSVVTYLGTWNAATNTPTLANGTGDAGDMYICNVAGTVNFGAGPITFAVGDWVLYGSGTWQKSNGQNGTVTSVAVTETGNALTITGSPITTAGTINIGFAGSSTQYIAGDGTLVTFPTIITEAQNLITDVYNETGATLTKGTVVYINGGHGNLPTVTKAIATSDATSAQTYGVIQADITNNNNGHVVVIGSLGDLDTQAYAAGTQLYLSSTTAGAWTSVKQYAPAHLVYVGIVVRSHPTQGVVEIKIQNGFELDELHNVSAQTPSNNQGLFYNSSNSLWENKSIATALGYTPANAATTLTINGTTYDISANRTWNVGTVTGSGSADQVAYWNSATGLTYDSTFYYSASNKRLGVNTNTPNATIGANIAIDGGYGLLVKNADNNYNGLGIGIDSTYGNLIASQKLGTASARNVTILNQSGYHSLTEAGSFGLNILTPTASPSGVGSVGIDVYGGSNAAGIGFHNVASGVGNTNGAYIYLTNALSLTLRNLEGSIVSSSLGDFSVITNSTENFRVNASNGSLWQSNITSAVLKANSSNVIVAAVAGTDYQAPITLTTTGSSGAATFSSNTLNVPNYTLSGLGGVPTSRTLTINGTAYDLSADRSWSVGTLTGGGADGRVAFWNGASNVVSDSLFVWDDTNNRLGIGLVNPQRALEIYSSSPDTHLRLSGAAPSVSMGEAITGSIYQAKFGLATANNQFVTGSVAGDFVINNQTGSTIWAYNSTEKMRLDTNGNLGVGGIANSSYRLHVFGTGTMLGIETTAASNVYLRMLQAGTVVGGMYYNNSDSTLRINNNNGGLRFDTSTVNGALTIASTGAATFSSSVTAGGLTVNGGGSNGLFINGNNGAVTIPTTGLSITTGYGVGYINNYGTGGSYADLYLGASKFLFSGGNVGIGTSSPKTLLQLTGGGIGAYHNSGSSNGAQLYLGDTNFDNASYYNSAPGIGSVYNATQGVAGDLAFYTYASVANSRSERMRIQGNTGNVGIGTSSPSGKLQVVLPAYTNEDTDSQQAIFGSGTSGYGVRIGYNESNNAGYINSLKPQVAWSNLYIQASNIIFAPTATERMRITSGGAVGMNTSSPDNSMVLTLRESGTLSGALALINRNNTKRFDLLMDVNSVDDGAFGIYDRTAGAYRQVITSGGDILLGGNTTYGGVGISIRNKNTYNTGMLACVSGDNVEDMFYFYSNTSTLAGIIGVNGNTTSYYSVSDYRAKQDLKDFNGLDIISKFKMYDFEWILDGTRNFGGIAHEIQEILPYAVTGEKDGERNQAVDYSKLVPVLVKAIQELSAKVTELENKLK